MTRDEDDDIHETLEMYTNTCTDVLGTIRWRSHVGNIIL